MHSASVHLRILNPDEHLYHDNSDKLFLIIMSMTTLTSALPFGHLDDEFHLAIYELSNGPISFDEERLLNLKFNQLLPGNRKLALSNDLDPDSFNCDYFIEHSLNKMPITFSQNKVDCLSFFHLNIRSLVCNFDCINKFIG